MKAVHLDGTPRSKGARDRIGEAVPLILDTQERVKRDIEKLRPQRLRLRKYIDSIADPYTRKIFELRFIHLHSWSDIAGEMGGKVKGDGIRAKCYRYIERHTGE